MVIMLKFPESIKVNLILSLAICLSFFSCKSQSIDKQEVSVKSFQGTWFEIGEENASFRVEGTEVIYIENQDMPAKIEVRNDSIILNFGNQIMFEKIERLDNDTLTLTNDGISTTYVRRE